MPVLASQAVERARPVEDGQVPLSPLHTPGPCEAGIARIRDRRANPGAYAVGRMGIEVCVEPCGSPRAFRPSDAVVTVDPETADPPLSRGEPAGLGTMVADPGLP
jgi:hypothetical protein